MEPVTETPAEPIDCYIAPNNTNPNITWHYSCNEDFSYFNDFIFFIMSTLSIVILVLLSRRDNLRGVGRNCLWGHPGIVFPLNMLDGFENRLAYCAAFGSMTFELTSILWNPFSRFTSFGIGHEVMNDQAVMQYPIIRLMLVLVQVGLCTYLFSPLFFALATRYKFIGAILGIMISTFKLCSWIWMSTCADMEYSIYTAGFKVNKWLLAILLWPCIICMGVLIWQFIIILIKCVRTRHFGYWEEKQPIAMEHHMEHVKYLLGKKRLPWTEESLHHVSIFNKEKFLANFALRRIPGFRFPTRVLATFTVTVLAVYQIGVQVAFKVYSLLKVVRRMVRCGNEILGPSIEQYIQGYTDYILHYANVAANLWIGCMLFVCIIAIGYVYHMCLCYRKHTLRIYRGEKSIFPSNWIRESNHSILTSASRHAGLQIAYTIWGLVIIQIFIFFIMCLIIFVLIIPAVDFKYYDILEWVFQVFVFSLIVNQLIYFGQLILNRVLFLQRKINPSDERPPLAIDNRKAWYNLSFFIFFWNLFLGLFSALMRILKGLILGVFFIPRIDRPVLMKGFETMDNGFYAYLSLLSVIHTHDHPVVKVFVKVLVDSLKDSSYMTQGRSAAFTSKTHDMPLRSNIIESLNAMSYGSVNDPVYTDISSNRGVYYNILNEDDDQLEQFEENNYGYSDTSRHHSRKVQQNRNTVAGSKRAKYYWCLAYTLINNPDLLNYRKVEVESDEMDGHHHADPSMKKHKIVLAILRKRKGERATAMYNTDD